MKHGFRNAALPILLFALPLIASAALSAKQELGEAVRARPNLDHGAELFRNCVPCHGSKGMGAPDGTVPAIAAQHYRVIVKQLVDYRHAQRWDIRMERLADQHLLKGPQEISDVAGYVSSLTREQPTSAGTGEFVDHGKDVYTRLCASCHGPAAQGSDSKSVPKLAGEHYEYLLRQMYDAVEGRRPNMSSAHRSLLKRFVVEDYEGVADYLSRQTPPR